MIRARAWCFTLNNYSDEEVSTNYTQLSKYCVKFVFQEETGEQGTPHLQGVAYFKEAKTITAVKKIMKCERVHLEKCKNINASINYCSKTETRTGKIYQMGIEDEESEIEDFLENKELYDWQKEILDILRTKPDARTIHVIIDKEGNKGKSALCRHIMINYKRTMILCGKGADMKYAITQYIEKNKSRPKNILIDLSRTCEQFVSYQGIEEIKNGIFFSPKFKSECCIMNPPHVIIFTNFELSWNALSKDRWNIKYI